MKLPRKLSIASIVILLFLLLAFLGGYLFVRVRQQAPSEVDLTSQATQPRPIPGSEEFTNQKYIYPLENNATGSIYSTRAQLRGVVSSWSLGTFFEKGTLVVTVGEKEFSIGLPDKVELLCLPLTKTGDDGVTYKMSDIYLTLENATGVMVDTEVVSQKIPEGAEITLQVKVDEDENMEASFIVGYGCSIE